MLDDSTKVKAYFDLFWESYRRDYKISLEYASKAEELSRELGLSFQLADAHRVKSFPLSGMGRYNESKKELEKALEIFKRLNDKKMTAWVLTEFGWLSKTQSNFEEALSFFWDALRISSEIGDKDNMAQNRNYIAAVYVEQKQYNKAIENYKKALDLVEELGIKPGISACLTNLASVYTLAGSYEEALNMNARALELKIEMGDRLGEARVRNNLGSLHSRLRNFSKAEMNFEKALDIAMEVGDKRTLSTIQFEMAQFHFDQGNYSKSLEVSSTLKNSTNPNEELELSVKLRKLLFETYGKLGDYKKAHGNALEWKSLADSLYNKNMLTVANDLEAKYQSEQQSKEIALLASERELQELQLSSRENQRNVLIVIAVLALLIIGLLYNQYRIKQKANKELLEINQLKSNFFANISHEFRTPLTLIKGPIEQLEQNPEEKLEREEVKMIRRNTNKVLGLVDQLLELSKIDQDKLQLKPTEGDLYKCLRTAVFSFNSHAAQRHIDYRVEIPNKTLWASFDRDKLEKVIYNLLSNAFKFSEDGAMVSFSTSYANDYLNIQVSDSGKGISEDKLPFIFDRFYQVDGGTTKEQGGSGIGLSLSKDLIELMDGTITASSEEGKGTFFTVQLPLLKIETREKGNKNVIDANRNVAEEPQIKPYEFAETDDRGLPQILLVEDNADMRQFIKGNLIQSYKILETHDGQKGLEMAQSNQPDLIITDLMMPKMDGIELCKQLKESLDTSHIPVIMLTARAGVENKIEGLESGSDDYLTKPFNAKELITRVQNLIAQRQRLRNHFKEFETKLDPSKIATTSLDEKFIKKFLDLLEQKHSDSGFGVPQIQKGMAMSKTQLHRKIKALTNESPGEVLRNFRLKRAAHLLTNKSDTVTQIAYQVGFNNLSYFAKCFKAYYGVSPSSY
ncbi:tetratricopeptide repeat protein [Flagellimonas eckloniae]|uniref:hybrid sensor histidine kinase/response regulator transcription factor n=1 Tax=Flagellimonas eckloniae TaxID=346185 RepID=UPI001585CCD5|nr:tetratricopeptide repeat protein [Allomuricauda eckloniae]